MRFSGKVAIVTGAARGLGAEVARRLAKEGADIAVVDISEQYPSIANQLGTKEQHKGVVDEIKAMGRRAIAIKADVSKSNEVNEMVRKTLDEFGKIDILVSNAAIAVGCDFLEITEELWDAHANIILKGTFLCCQAVLPHMIKQKKGKIVTISSGVAKRPGAGYCAYNAAKAGVNALTMVVALEMAPFNINANVVCPGIFRTDMLKSMLPFFSKKQGIQEDKVEDMMVESPPLKELKIEEIASLVLFLASDEADGITGQSIEVDRGLIIQMP